MYCFIILCCYCAQSGHWYFEIVCHLLTDILANGRSPQCISGWTCHFDSWPITVFVWVVAIDVSFLSLAMFRCSGLNPAGFGSQHCVRSALNLNEVRDFHLQTAYCFASNYSRYACSCLFFRCGVDLHRDDQLNYTVVLVSPFCGSMDSSWFKLTIVDILSHWVFPLYTIRTRRSAWIIVKYYYLLSLVCFRWLWFNQPWRLTYWFAIG